MSTLFSSDNGWVISHDLFLQNMYKNVKKDNESFSLSYSKDLFNINSKFYRKNQINTLNENKSLTDMKRRKRKIKDFLVNLDEINKVEELYIKVLKEAKNNLLFKNPVMYDFNNAARELSQNFFDDTNCDNIKNTKGFNSCNFSQIVKIQGEEYVIPEKSTFYCYDVMDNERILKIDKQFDFILMDPPWWNKSVRRRKAICSKTSYSMLHNKDFVDIPITKLLKPNGIVCVWCTNSASCLESILEDMFHKWNIIFKAKWYWIKITIAGDVVSDFNKTYNKQPFETIVLGSFSQSLTIENDKVFLSVPSAVHSHKPPVIDMLKKYLPPNPQCLEIFARYLLPNWHSLGLEVLKFQHLSLFNHQTVET